MQAFEEVFELEFTDSIFGFPDPEEPFAYEFWSAWAQATEVLADRGYSGSRATYLIHVDWSAIRDLAATWRTSIDSFVSQFRQNQRFTLAAVVTVNTHEELAPAAVRHSAHHYVKQFIYDFFLIMNIAVPGCCEFYNLRIIDNVQEFSPGAEPELKLSSYTLLSSWQWAFEEQWPPLQALSVKHVLDWFDSLRLGAKQVAESRTERGLFSLLHVCSLEAGLPTVMWIAHALEALFQTPAALITEHLQRRIHLALEVPAEQQKSIRKQIRAFYELRSQFVHGKFRIVHPLENELHDVNVDSYRTELYDEVTFGAGIVLAALQKLVVMRWNDFEFVEVFSGVEVSPSL